MIYKPGELQKRSKQIILARNWAIGVFVTMLGVHLFVSEVKRIYNLPPDPMNYAYLLLLIVTGFLVFLWIWATQKELDLLFEWMDPERYVPPSSIKETLMILFFGIVLTSLLFSAHDPCLYGVVFSIYSIVLIPSTKYMNHEIYKIIVNSKKRILAERNNNITAKEQLYGKAIDVLQAYFIERPMVLRLFMISIASIIGLIAAIYWKISGVRLYGLFSYFIFIITICISEMVINRWRFIRDSDLRKLEQQLVEYRGSSSNIIDAQQ